MTRYRIARWAAPLLLLLALVIVPTPAYGVFGIGDCTDPPLPQAPGGGMTGFFIDDAVPTPGGEPWVDDGGSGHPSYPHYGFAGMEYYSYDLGCGADLFVDPSAVIGTTLGNWGLEAAKFGIALTGAVLDAAYTPDFLSVFDPLVERATGALTDAIWTGWGMVSVVLVGVLLLWGARRADWAKTVSMVVWAFLVIIIVSAVANYPTQAGSVADESIGNTLGAVNAGINGGTSTGDPVDAAMESLSTAVVWNQWKAGTFGRANGETATKYARVIYQSQSLTYAEAETVRNDPDGAGQALLEEKAETWENAAEAIKESDPSAYTHLAGTAGTSRFAGGLVAVFAALCTAPFLLMSAFLMLGAYLLIRLAVMLLPAFGVIGLVYQGRGAVIMVGMIAASAVVNNIMFGVAAAVTILGVNVILDPVTQLPLWLALVVMAVWTFVMWTVTGPARRLTSMASPGRMFRDGAGAVGDLGGQVKSLATSVVKTAGSAAITGHVAGAVAAGRIEDAVEDRVEGTDEDTVDVEPAAPVETPTPISPGREPAALPPGNTPVPDDDVFTPGAVPPDDDPTLPTILEPAYHDDGVPVYDLFVPDDTAGSGA